MSERGPKRERFRLISSDVNPECRNHFPRSCVSCCFLTDVCCQYFSQPLKFIDHQNGPKFGIHFFNYIPVAKIHVSCFLEADLQSLFYCMRSLFQNIINIPFMHIFLRWNRLLRARAWLVCFVYLFTRTIRTSECLIFNCVTFCTCLLQQKYFPKKF